MKKLNFKAFSCAALAVLIPIFAQAAGSVTLSTPVQSPSGATVSSGLSVTITVDATPVGGAVINTVNLIYSHNDGARTWWVTNAMGLVSGVTYSAVLPPLPTGTVSYRVSCRYNDVELTQTALVQYTILTVPSVGSGRYMPFDTTWTLDYQTNRYYPVDGGRRWYGSGVYRFNTTAETPVGGTKPTYALLSIVGAYIQSPPLEGGVGTVYFTSQLNVAGQTAQIHVQVSTNGLPSAGEWETVSILNYPLASTKVNVARPVLVNRSDVRCVRFVRTADSPYDPSIDKTTGAVSFDNIVLSYPPADIRMEERLRNPGYPSRDQSVKMRCAVIDANPNAPAVNRQVKIFYQWVQNVAARPLAGAWLSTNMYSVGDGVYEGVIPQRNPGYVHYFYKCDFDGYFYSRDPDGGTGPEPTNSEKLSPNYWSDGESLAGEPIYYSKYEVRAFRSEYGQVWLDAVPAQATVPMDLVGDESWQGITLVTGITNLNWHFVGMNRYTNDAATYASAPVTWGENDQGFVNPPIGGKADVDGTNGIIADLEYDGFLLMRLSTEGEYLYMVKRAVYQNFDQWLASKTDFEESLGLYAVMKYEEDFDTWALDGYTQDQSKGEAFEMEFFSGTFAPFPVQTWYGWVMQQGRVLVERKPFSAQLFGNQALLLNGLGGGRVGNSGDSLTMGIEKMTYATRASINDRHAAIYQNGYGFAHGQQIEAVFSVAQLSPEYPYVSVLASYQPDYFLGASYYEIRFIQSNETQGTQTDNRLSGEVWRWNAGSTTPTKIGTTQDVGAGKLIVDKTVTITISGTAPSVTISVVANGTTRTYTDSGASRLTTGGTVGFLTHDAVPLVKNVTVKSYPDTTTIRMTASNFNDLTAWYLGGSRADGGGTRWSKVTHTDTTIRLTRLVPTQRISIYMAPRRPGAPSPAVEDLVLKHADIVVDSLEYAFKTEWIEQWNEGFVEVRYQSGDVDVVVDDLRLYPWRANTRSADNSETADALGVNYYDWTSKAQQYEWLKNERGWAVLEGTVADAINVRGNDVHLERSRANPNLDQALVSPVLTNGIGIINFVYTVSGGTAIYAVERTDEGVQQNWTTIATFTNTAFQTGTRYVAIRENFMGRIRVRMLATSDINAKLMIDDAEARDYPPRDDTTWQAYNVLVTDLQTNRLYSGQSCYLNNSATADVGGTGVALTEHQPFVQTPSVGTGIGEIAFMYRSWTGTPTVLTLKVAPTPDTPDEDWVLITNLTVSGTSYIPFNNPNIYDLDNHVLRVYGNTNGADRICIDNILVTEPVRAGYEIQTVRLVPDQPLVDGPVAVEVDIGRFLMNPVGIKIYVSYHVGSNAWGVANWWTREETTESRLVQLQPIAPGSRTYRTPVDDLLPAFAVDTVVQFYAWGTHSEIEAPGQPPILQNASFDNPTWYAPIDLNIQYAALGWSPYYIVYSCAPGAIWVNEINNYATTRDGQVGEFIELIGPANTEIGGWRIEAINYSTREILPNASCVIPKPTSLNNKTLGWGFFVLGDPVVVNVNQLFASVQTRNIPLNGGLHLIRSCGAYEQKLCFGTSARAALEDEGYVYAGAKGTYNNAALAMVTKQDVEAGSTLDDFYWPPNNDYGSYTPGDVNGLSQRLADITPPPAGYVLLTSVIGAYMRHDGVTETPITEQVTVGSNVAIAYAADPWFRIGTFESNGATVAEAIGQSNFLWQAAAMSADISNHVTCVAVGTYGEDIPISWLSRWSEQAVASGDGDPFGVDEEFLMNTDPTATTTANLKVTAIHFVGTTLQVTVKMERDTITPYNAGDINGMLYLQSRASLLSGTFEDVAGTAITGAVFNDGAGGDEYTYTFEGITNASLFYRAVIK